MELSVKPFYTIHRYRDDVYKVVAFKGARVEDPSLLRLHPEEQQHNENKLASNFSRARSMVLQYAICNPWSYFFTGTLDKSKIDRYDLDTYQHSLMQFVRDKRKAYSCRLQVLLVPERHKDGAWHMHGLIAGLDKSVLSYFSPPAPQHLIDGGFLNWSDYADKYGFCSLAPVRDPLATAFYVTKYISKDLSGRDTDLGRHLYFHSRPLRKAEKASDVYMPNKALDDCCDADFEFCKVGMVEDKDWTFPLAWDGVELDDMYNPRPLQVASDFNPATIDPFYDQTSLF